MAEVQSSLQNGSSEKDAASETVAAIAETQVISAGKILTPSTLDRSLVFSLLHTDEIALYDRQIRLWGVKAQEK